MIPIIQSRITSCYDRLYHVQELRVYWRHLLVRGRCADWCIWAWKRSKHLTWQIDKWAHFLLGSDAQSSEADVEKRNLHWSSQEAIYYCLSFVSGTLFWTVVTNGAVRAGERLIRGTWLPATGTNLTTPDCRDWTVPARKPRARHYQLHCFHPGPSRENPARFHLAPAREVTKPLPPD